MTFNIVTAAVLAVIAVSAASLSATAQTQPQPQTRNPPPAARAPAPPAAPARPPASAQQAPAPAASTAEPAVKGSEVIARVGTSDVTAEEVRSAISFLDPRQQAALARDPALLSQTVKAILANRLVLKEALAKKWDQQPAIAALLARTRESLIAETYLQSMTAPPDN